MLFVVEPDVRDPKKVSDHCFIILCTIVSYGGEIDNKDKYLFVSFVSGLFNFF
jgi:hypothetical protein